MTFKDQLKRITEDSRIGEFVRENESLVKKLGIIAGVIAVIAILFFPFGGNGEEVSVDNETMIVEETVAESIYVDIGGEVVHPKLVELEDGCRVEDAIEAAGGLTKDADLSSINRAAFINDGDKIYIPSVNETADSGGGTSTALGGFGTAGGKININIADSEELQTLTGVGPVTADKIIAYRESNGRFSSIEDIKNVSGIGDKTYEKLKDSITTR